MESEKFDKDSEIADFIADDLIAAWNRRVDHLPVVRGEWIEHPTKDSVLCSCCYADWNLFDNDTYRFCYCPNCGAKIEGERRTRNER
jgi:hypothetical protein